MKQQGNLQRASCTLLWKSDHVVAGNNATTLRWWRWRLRSQQDAKTVKKREKAWSILENLNLFDDKRKTDEKNTDHTFEQDPTRSRACMPWPRPVRLFGKEDQKQIGEKKTGKKDVRPLRVRERGAMLSCYVVQKKVVSLIWYPLTCLILSGTRGGEEFCGRREGGRGRAWWRSSEAFRWTVWASAFRTQRLGSLPLFRYYLRRGGWFW